MDLESLDEVLDEETFEELLFLEAFGERSLISDALSSMAFFSSNKGFLVNSRFGDGKNGLSRLKGQHYRIGVIVDLSCEENFDYFYNVSDAGFFNTSYVWVVISDTLVEPLKRAKLMSTADLTMVSSGGIYRLRRRRSDLDVDLIHMGNWEKEKPLKLTSVPSVSALFGETLTASIYLTQEIYDKYDTNKLSQQLQNITFYEGQDLPNRLSYALQLGVAKFVIFVFADHYGAVLPNGTHNGMMGHLERHEANFTLGAAKHLPDRWDVSDALVTTHEYWFPFVFIQPRVLGSYKALSLPLSPLTWISLALLLMTASFAFITSQTYGDFKISKRKETLSGCFLQFVGVYAQQGLTIDPVHFSSKIICIFMLFVGTMVLVYYNGYAMNALLSPNPPMIKNIKDLVKSDIKLSLVDSLYFNNVKVRNRLIPRIAYEKVDKYMTRTYSLDEGLQLIKKGNAFCAEYFWLYEAIDRKFDERTKCELSIVLASPPFPVTSFVTKYSHLRELFNRGILWMKENGLSKRELIRWFPQKPTCKLKQDFVVVRLEAISIALIIFLIGLVLSLTIFFIELRSRKKKRVIFRHPLMHSVRLF